MNIPKFNPLAEVFNSAKRFTGVAIDFGEQAEILAAKKYEEDVAIAGLALRVAANDIRNDRPYENGLLYGKSIATECGLKLAQLALQDSDRQLIANITSLE